MKRSVTARRQRISAIKLIDDLSFGDNSGPAAGSNGFSHSLCTFLRGSSGMGVELAGWEVIMACAGAGAAMTTAVVTAATAITSPPMLTIGRGRVREWLRLLSAQASLRLLSCVRLLSLADRRPGWHEEGGGIICVRR